MAARSAALGQFTTISKIIQKLLTILHENFVRVGLLADSYREVLLRNCTRSGRGLKEPLFAISDETKVRAY